MVKVNLDALIPREDFLKEDCLTDNSEKADRIKLSELESKNSFLFSVLRKPDFQRETNEWTPVKVVNLIESFVNQDLIPAIIMWSTKGSYTFVIDGSHRLSALIAWVNDDYGDGAISRKFFEIIPEDQIKIAKKTRKLVESRVHSYNFYKQALEQPKGIDEEIVNRARDLTRHSIQLQWVRGNVKKAEESFFKINQEAVKISPTELALSKAREKPNGIVARAIKNSGMGHKYWSKFPQEKQFEIEKLAKEINTLLFIPPLKQPIKSIDMLPIGGKAACSLPLVLTFVNLVNGLVDKREEDIDIDVNGDKTLEYLQKCRSITLKINSNDSSSLGLHPAIYLYSNDGNYKPVSFYAIVSLLLDFEANKSLQDKFISVRSEFEKHIWNNGEKIQNIVRKYRRGIKSYIHLKNYYVEIINNLYEKRIPDDSITSLENKFNKNKDDSKDFSVSDKSAIVIKESIKNALKCQICGGLIDSKSITIDHIQRKQDGGLGVIDNGQIAHPYCNTTYKN